MYGRLTTLNLLKQVRDDYTKHPFTRMQAARSIAKIKEQMRDKNLLQMRERLIKATQAGDQHEVWKIENQIKAYEGKHEGIEVHE